MWKAGLQALQVGGLASFSLKGVLVRMTCWRQIGMLERAYEEAALYPSYRIYVERALIAAGRGRFLGFAPGIRAASRRPKAR